MEKWMVQAMPRLQFGAVPGVLALTFSVSVFAAPADSLRTLLEQGKPEEAYRVAKTTPNEQGNPQFDFYFGVAAVNSGKPSEGVLALE